MSIEALLGVVLLVAATLYAALAGADFGAGVWEFNLAFRPSERDRKLLQHAIGPVWEANHVWMIFVLVVLHSAFPPAFAAVSRALFLPLLLALLGIVLRGTGFALRYYGEGARRQQALWGVVFALASVIAPFFLGAAVGAIAEGGLPVTSDGRFHGDWLTDWVSPLSIYLGFFNVGLCAYLAAVYLCRDAEREGGAELAEIWRRRALATGAGVGLLAGVGLAVAASTAPRLWEGVVARGWPLVGLSALTGLLTLTALYRRKYAQAVVAAAATVACVIGGWGLAQYPALLPPAITLASAKAPDRALHAVAWGIGGGGVLLAPSLAWLLYLFKGHRPEPGPAR
ncbi:MAG: cytochrome d ubiquinol oxidase subunit II [Acidobacteria bacterium]|nr:cytochrome d ubiquinol oxidase subunit II [Acidobacteriota bacterium]